MLSSEFYGLKNCFSGTYHLGDITQSTFTSEEIKQIKLSLIQWSDLNHFDTVKWYIV